MIDCIIAAILGCCVILWLYSCYKDFTSDKKEKKAIKQALKEADYV